MRLTTTLEPLILKLILKTWGGGVGWGGVGHNITKICTDLVGILLEKRTDNSTVYTNVGHLVQMLVPSPAGSWAWVQ